MGHSWYSCPDCGDDVPDCDCCESARPHDEECVPTHDVRYRESMAALSRFLVFVWMEAQARTVGEFLPTQPLGACRYIALAYAMDKGFLKLVWP